MFLDKIEFVDKSVGLAVHCLSLMEEEHVDLISSVNKLTEDDQRVKIWDGGEEVIFLKRVKEGEYCFVLKQYSVINFTHVSATFSLRN